MKARWVLWIGAILAAAPAWGADESATLNAHVTAVTRVGETPEGKQVVPQRLSQELGMSAQTLQAQRQQTGLGWGEILIANRISQRTGMTFSQVVGEFRSGKGWGEIARERNLNVGKLVSEVKESNAGVQAAISASGHGRSGGENGGITSGANRPQAGAEAGAGAEGRFGQGGGRGGPGVTFGSGASGHGSGGLGLGVHGGGRR